MTNTDHSADHFLMEPAEQFRVVKSLRAGRSAHAGDSSQPSCVALSAIGRGHSARADARCAVHDSVVARTSKPGVESVRDLRGRRDRAPTWLSKRRAMRVAESLVDLVGDTPLLRLARLFQGAPARVLGKLEFFNPASSVKDRTGLSMVMAAERSGKLKPGMTIVEPTQRQHGNCPGMESRRCVGTS